jgi:hypothetical protein
MPTSKPRVIVTLDPHVHETIQRLADLQGRSRGKVISELLEAVHPPLMRTVALLEAAREAPEQVKSGLRGTIEQMEHELQESLGGSVQQMDYLLDQMGTTSAADAKDGSGGDSEKPSASERRRSTREKGKGTGQGSNPRPGNTGVRSSRTRIPPSGKGE